MLLTRGLSRDPAVLLFRPKAALLNRGRTLSRWDQRRSKADVASIGKRYRGILSFESRFFVPGENMTAPEYLSRGSALLLKKKHPKSGKTMAGIVTSRHIAHPFATPFYYQEAMSWLQHLRPEHIHFYISLVGLDGPAWEMELEREMLRVHPTLDVCLFQFPTSESQWFIDEMTKLDHLSFLSPIPFEEADENKEFPKFASVECAGFDYSQDTGSDQISANRFSAVKGRILSGEIETALRRKVDSDGSELVSAREFRAETERKLQFGMCGGPVVLGHNPSKLLGVIEGIEDVNGIVHCLPADTIWDMFDPDI